MKQLTLNDIRTFQPPFFEILMKHRGQWHIAGVTAAPVIFLLDKNNKTACLHGFGNSTLSQRFSWAKTALMGLKKEYDTFMQTAAPLMYQFIRSRSIFVLYEQGDSETVFNYFDKKTLKGESSMGSCSQVISNNDVFSVIQFNASQYEPDVCLLAHEMSHHADRVPLHITDKLNFIHMSFSDTPLFKNTLAYEIAAHPQLGLAAQTDAMMRQKIQDNEYNETHYYNEMFARLNTLFIDNPIWFKKNHPVMGNLLEHVAQHIITLKTQPSVFDTYHNSVFKYYQDTLLDKSAEQPLNHLKMLQKMPHLKGDQIEWIQEAGVNITLPPDVLRNQLNYCLLKQAKVLLNTTIHRFYKKTKTIERIFKKNHQYILCNRHRLYQQTLPITRPPIPFCIKEYQRHD